MQITVDAFLSFWSYNSWTSDYDKNSVVILGEEEIELWSPASVSQSQVQTVIDLSAYKNQTISIAFKYEGSNAHGWYIDDVLVSAIPSLDFNETGYATYYNADNAYIMPEGVVGHVFSVEGNAETNQPVGLTQAYASNTVVPAAVPLVLEGNAGVAYTLMPTDETGTNPTAVNDLIGVNEATTIADDADYYFYVLSMNAAGASESVGFYWMNETGAGGFDMPAHKAYLKVAREASEAAPRFYLFHGENNATWLNNLRGVDGATKFWYQGHIYILRDNVIYDATGKRVELVLE